MKVCKRREKVKKDEKHRRREIEKGKKRYYRESKKRLVE